MIKYWHSHARGKNEYNFIVESQYIGHNTKVSKTKRINIETFGGK